MLVIDIPIGTTYIKGRTVSNSNWKCADSSESNWSTVGKTISLDYTIILFYYAIYSILFVLELFIVIHPAVDFSRKCKQLETLGSNRQCNHYVCLYYILYFYIIIYLYSHID